MINKNVFKVNFFKEHRIDYILLLIALLFKFVSSYITLFFYGIIVLKDFVSKRVKFKIDIGLLLLVTAVLLYFRNAYFMGLATLHNCLWVSVLSILSYLIGKGFGLKLKDERSVYFFIFYLFFLLALSQIPITLYDIFVNGLVNPDRDIAVLGDDESQQLTTSRTIQLSMAISGIFMLFYQFKDKGLQYVRNSYIVLAIIAELCTLHYVSRTGIALFIIAFTIGGVIKQGISRRTLFFTIILLFIIYIIKETSLGAVFADREIEGSSIGDAGGRTDRWEMGLLMLLSSPNGYEWESYAHNFWLDFGREGGLISCVVLIIFSLYALWNGYLSMKRKTIFSYLSSSIFVYSIMFPITFFTEPIHVGCPVAMYGYYIFTGMVVELNRRSKKEILVKQ